MNKEVSVNITTTFADRIMEQLLQFPTTDALELFSELGQMISAKEEVEIARARAYNRGGK